MIKGSEMRSRFTFSPKKTGIRFSLVFERLRPVPSCFYGVYQIGDV
jgi:hypothetical protein